MTKTGKKINGKQKLTPSDIVVHIILVILFRDLGDPDSVDRSDQLPWRKKDSMFLHCCQRRILLAITQSYLQILVS